MGFWDLAGGAKLGFWDFRFLKLGFWDLLILKLGFWDPYPPYAPLSNIHVLVLGSVH